VSQAHDILRDPQKRSQYDAELRERAMKAETAITDVIDLNNCTFDEENAVYLHRCRCGSVYRITEDALERGISIYRCDGCSAAIHVLYQEVDE